jgi:LuxR family maltose regulon positive regulatory protein
MHPILSRGRFGLYLAALIARESSTDASAISGDDRYVADYLYREALMRQPESMQRFLRRTAVLDHLAGPLCDAVLGESSSQEQLRALEASNSFLIPLDRRRQWYRYHGLFREFLLGELRRVDPDAVGETHLRAADWYEANGSKALAIEHLLHTTERERCVKLVAELLLPTYQAGQLSRVEGWLSALGETAIEQYPPLAVLAGWVAVLTGHTADALHWAAIIDAASFDGIPADGSASFESGRAILRSAMCPAGPEQCMADARLAVDQEPAWSPWRDQALYVYGEAHLLSGARDEAWAVFEETVAAAAAASNARSSDVTTRR